MKESLLMASGACTGCAIFTESFLFLAVALVLCVLAVLVDDQ